MKKLLVLASAAVLMAACSDSPTDPASAKRSPSARPNADFTCRSGYVVAFDENGNPYCVPESPSGGSTTSPTATPTSGTTTTKTKA